MAGERLENYVWKISTIAKVWKVFGWTEDEEKEASNISRKFPGILKGKLKMSDEELNKYKSVSSGGGSGQYIFAGDERVPIYLKEFFDIFNKHKFITAKEKKDIHSYLVSFLPDYQTAKEYKDAEEAFKELEKDRKEIKMKFELSDLGDYFDRQNTRDGIEEFYLESRTWWFFEERIFFKVGAKKFIKKSIPKKIYGYEYKWVENWKTKWEKIMGEAVQIRQLERFDNGYEICQELGLEKEVRQKLYEEGVCGDNKIRDLCQGKNWIDSATLCDYLCSKYPLDEPDYENNERQMSGKKCLEECSKIFTELWENKLKKMDKEDADCIKGMAFEELEKMRPMVIGRYNEEILRQEKEIANLEWDKLGELYVIREKADKARKQIWRM